MNLDDARTVLEWRYKEAAVKVSRFGLYRLRYENGDYTPWSEIDANLIHGEIVPALEERLGVDYIRAYNTLSGRLVVIASPSDEWQGTGPTFEAAMISAAAKAVRSV